MPVKLSDLDEALTVVGGGMSGDGKAWVCRATGEVIWYSEEMGDLPPLPKDINNAKHYVPVPDKRDLDLGKSLAVDFVFNDMPDFADEVYAIFSRRGAWRRFRDFVERHDRLAAWYEWEETQTHKALRAWCAENHLTPAD